MAGGKNTDYHGILFKKESLSIRAEKEQSVFFDNIQLSAQRILDPRNLIIHQPPNPIPVLRIRPILENNLKILQPHQGRHTIPSSLLTYHAFDAMALPLPEKSLILDERRHTLTVPGYYRLKKSVQRLLMYPTEYNFSVFCCQNT